MWIEGFRFWHEDDYEYEIFSLLSSALAWTNVILAGKCDSRRHPTTGVSENVVVAGISYQIVIVLQPGKGETFSNKNNGTNFSGENSTMKPSWLNMFRQHAKKL